MIYNAKINAIRKLDANRAQISEILSHPLIKSLLDGIEEEALPKRQAKMMPGISPDITDARDAHFRRGICEAIQTIRNSIYPMNQSPEEVFEETPFEHTLPPDLRLENLPEKLRKHLK